MKAAVLHAKDDLRYEEYPTPQVKAGEVMVRVRASGICGSDIPRVLADEAHFFPIVLGHEFSGDVVEVGEGVTLVKVGDRVAGVPRLPCHKCDDCLKGNHSICKNYSFIGSRVQGSFADYLVLPERNAVKINPNVSYEQGALFEPCTVAFHGMSCGSYEGGEDVAVLGGGTIGLFAAQWARIYGAKRVFVFDIDSDRLEIAKRLGVDVAINTTDPGFREAVKDYTDGKGLGFIFETAGSDVTIKLAIELAANKGKISFVGTPRRDTVVSPKLFEQIGRKELTLNGSWQSYSAPFPGKSWELTAHFFSTGALRCDQGLVFGTFPLSEAKAAFDLYKTPGAVKGKILLIND